MKKYILAITVIMWAFLIFYASSKDSHESNSESKYVISLVVEKVSSLTNKFHLTNIDLSKENITLIVNKLNYPVRKLAHFSIYFILGILLYYTFISFGLPKKSIFVVFLLCFIYSISDEYHQTFTIGRTGRFVDCIIDTSGAICGCVSALTLYKIYKKYTQENLKNL